MNLTDLTEVLHAHASTPDSPVEARMAGVRAKVVAARRRRAMAGVACAVLAVVGIVFALLPRQAPPEPALPPRSLPEYQEGTRLIAQAWGDLPSTSVTTRFVPQSTDLKFFMECDTGQDRHLLVHLVVNGTPTFRGTCGGASTPLAPADLGIIPGRQSEVTLVVDGQQGEAAPGDVPPTVAAPRTGTIAIGVGQAVPVSEYPFPPRPQTLATFTPHYPEPTVELRSDPADPLRRQEITLAWPGPSTMLTQTNTPGRLRVYVNDVLVTDFSHWSYTAGGSQTFSPDYWEKGYGLKLEAGHQVRIVVVPERVTGEWRIEVSPRP